MDHGLMTGMFWAGVLLSAFPVMLGLGIAAYAFTRYLGARASTSGPGELGSKEVP